MGIVWLSYGYPMETAGRWEVDGNCELRSYFRRSQLWVRQYEAGSGVQVCSTAYIELSVTDELV